MEAIRKLYGELAFKNEASKEIEKLNKDMDKSKKGISDIQKGFSSYASEAKSAVITSIGLRDIFMAFGATEVVGFVKDLAVESMELAKALDEQKKSAKELAGDGFDSLQKSIEQTARLSKSFTNESELYTASKAALEYGASLDFVNSSLSGVQKLAATSGASVEDSLKSAQDAISKGQTQFLEQNKIYQDSIEEFKKLGSGMDEATKKRREFFLLNKMQQHSIELQEDYNKQMKSSANVQKRFNNAILTLKQNFGALLNAGKSLFEPLKEWFADLVDYFTDAENGSGRFKAAMILMGSVLAVIAAVNIPAMVTGLYAMAVAGWVAIAPWLPLIAIVTLVAIGIAGLILIIEDLYVWFQGGDSVIGEFLSPFSNFGIIIRKSISTAFQWLKGAFVSLMNWGKKWGKIFITLIFPIAGLFFYFDEIKAFFKKISSWFEDNVPAIPWESIIPNWVTDLVDFVKQGFAIPANNQEALAGKRAGGGPVSGGASYLVGEKGPEIFTPGFSGRIIPNSSLKGGGSGIKIGSLVGQIIIQGSNGEEAARQVKEAVLRALDDLARNILPAQLGLAVGV